MNRNDWKFIVFLSFACASVFTIALLLSLGVGRAPSENPNCYHIVNSDGQVYDSYYLPLVSVDGYPVYQNESSWGYVLEPNATIIDRDCLRRRGVEVPPIREEEDTP